MAVLRLVPSQGPPVPLEITKDRALVGREPGCDVVVSDGSVSRKHAQLEQRPNGWFVVDQGSANGTFVDSQRITETQLHSGQELRFGGMAFTIEIDGDDSATILTSAPESEATVMQEAVRPPSKGAPGVPAPPPPPAVQPPAPPWQQAPKTPVPSGPAAPKPIAPGPPKPIAPGPPPLPPRPSSPAAGTPPPGAPPAATPPPLPPRGAAPPPPPPPAGGPPPLPPRPGSRPPVVSVVDVPPPPPKKARGPMFWVAGGCCGCLILLAIFAGVIGGGVWFATTAIVDEARAQIADVKKGDLDAAYARMSESYRSANSREDFVALVEAHPSLKQNTDSTFSSRNVSNDKGTLGGTLTGGGTTERVNYSLIKEGGGWKISEIEFPDDPGGGAAPSSSSPRGNSAQGSGKLHLETLATDKAADPPGHVVAIKVRATGFGTEGSGDALRCDLVLDLETRGPGGDRIPALSRMELQSRDRPDAFDPPHVDFDVTVTLRDAADGNYTARLTVRDQMGRDIQAIDVPFSLP